MVASTRAVKSASSYTQPGAWLACEHCTELFSPRAGRAESHRSRAVKLSAAVGYAQGCRYAFDQ
jgi:hypothetical protein